MSFFNKLRRASDASMNSNEKKGDEAGRTDVISVMSADEADLMRLGYKQVSFEFFIWILNYL